MLTLLQSSAVAAVVLLCLTTYFFIRHHFLASLPLPPGPPATLLCGNVHQVPLTLPWQTYASWAKVYGPIVSYRVYRKLFVVLNTAKATTDLLESRSSIYSDRPMDRWMYLELVNRKLAVFNISSQNPRFKEYRKVLTAGLNSRSTKSYNITLEEERLRLLRALAATPTEFITHLRGNAGAIILKIAYGWTIQDMRDDFFVQLIHEAFQKLEELVRPGRWMVDSIPLLRFVPAWFPGAGFQRSAKEHRARIAQIDDIPHQWVKDQVATGNYIPSFTSQHLYLEDGTIVDPEQEDIIKWCSSALYTGGADTTVSVMTTFFFLMMLNPHAQARAQDEVDRVVGKSRLPSIGDKDDLPYVNAVLKEVLRWAPPAPLALSHRLTQDDTYGGFFIPRGTTVIPNIWAIMRDEDMYPNPETFNPDRFLSPNPEPDPRKWIFGFGRRVCPGAHFAEVSLLLNIASILAVFSISPAVDDRGNEIKPQIEFTTGITSHIKPFACHILLRSKDAETLCAGGD